jgi:hypothetical protein
MVGWHARRVDAGRRRAGNDCVDAVVNRGRPRTSPVRSGWIRGVR